MASEDETDSVSVTPEKDALRAPDNLSDVTFVFDSGQRLYLHRQVLAFHSPVFRTMFTGNFRERRETEVKLPGKDAAQFLQFLRTGIYPPFEDVTSEAVSFLLQLADEYNVTSTYQRCESYMLQLDPSIKFLLLAEKHHLSKLREKCIEFTRSCPWADLRPIIGELQRSTLEKIMLEREQKKNVWEISTLDSSDESTGSESSSDEEEEEDIDDTLLNQDELADVTLEFDEDQKLYVHSQILSIHSPVFRDMLLQAEVYSGSDLYNFKIQRASMADFRSFLHVSVYSPFTPVTDRRLECILKLAAEYRVASSLKECEAYLSTKPRSIKSLMLGQQYDFPELTQRCVEYAQSCPWDLLQPHLHHINKVNLESILNAWGKTCTRLASKVKKLTRERDQLLTSMKSIFRSQDKYRAQPGRHLHYMNQIEKSCELGVSRSGVHLTHHPVVARRE